MKRWIPVMLAAMMTLLQTGAFAESDDEIRNYTRYTDYTPQAAEPVGLIPGEDHRILVVWFSRVGNTMFDPDVDVVSSATLNRGEGGELVGNAQMIAGWIAEETKADVFQIQTAYTYPSDYYQTVQVGEGQDIDFVDLTLATHLEDVRSYAGSPDLALHRMYPSADFPGGDRSLRQNGLCHDHPLRQPLCRLRGKNTADAAKRHRDPWRGGFRI